MGLVFHGPAEISSRDPEPVARLSGVYTSKGTLQVAEEFVQDKTITIRLRYIDHARNIAQSPGIILVRGDKAEKSVYLWGEMAVGLAPTGLAPGAYTVNVELDEYVLNGTKYVLAPKDKIRHHERLSCRYTVSLPGVDARSRFLGGRADRRGQARATAAEGHA